MKKVELDNYLDQIDYLHAPWSNFEMYNPESPHHDKNGFAKANIDSKITDQAVARANANEESEFSMFATYSPTEGEIVKATDPKLPHSLFGVSYELVQGGVTFFRLSGTLCAASPAKAHLQAFFLILQEFVGLVQEATDSGDFDARFGGRSVLDLQIEDVRDDISEERILAEATPSKGVWPRRLIKNGPLRKPKQSRVVLDITEDLYEEFEQEMPEEGFVGADPYSMPKGKIANAFESSIG